MISNYEKQVDMGKAHFLKYDQEALSAKFDLDLDKDYIYLTYLNTPCKIDRPSGTVFEKTSDGFAECRSYETVMTIYDMLCHGQETELPPLGGKWTPIANFVSCRCKPKCRNFFTEICRFLFRQSGCRRKRHVFPSAGFESRLLPVLISLQEFPAFSFFPVLLQFWESDKIPATD